MSDLVMDSELVVELQEGSVMTLRLNDPPTLNSLTSAMLTRLAETLRKASDDSSVKVIVITGAGTSFCAGQNLGERSDMRKIDVMQHLRDYYEPVLRAVQETEKPVIAAVNGVAAGAGFSLALSADFRIAAQSATFVQAFVRVGLVPDAGSTFFLPRLVGWGRAAELMLLGDTIDAGTALRYGMVSRVVEDDQLSATCAELAARLARGPRSLGLIKQLLRQSGSSSFEEQLAHEGRAQAEAVASDDFARGVMAFLGKTAPEFHGD